MSSVLAWAPSGDMAGTVKTSSGGVFISNPPEQLAGSPGGTSAVAAGKSGVPLAHPAGQVVSTGGGRQVPFVVPTHTPPAVQTSPDVHASWSSHAVPTG